MIALFTSRQPRAQGATYRCATHVFLFVTWRCFLSSPGQARFRNHTMFLFFTPAAGMEYLLLQLRWLEKGPSPRHVIRGLGFLNRWADAKPPPCRWGGHGCWANVTIFIVTGTHYPNTRAIIPLQNRIESTQGTRSGLGQGFGPLTAIR